MINLFFQGAAQKAVPGAIVAATLGSGLLIAPHPAPDVTDTQAVPATVVSPSEGSLVSAAKMWRDIKSPEPSEKLYERYVPPPPPPEPAVVPWVAPPGYFTIPVPVYRQLRALNCETAALQMGLATFGYYFSQDALFPYENPDLRPPVLGPNHTVLQWGDPYTNFVGDVNGSDLIPTGYGVYYPPIVAIARTHGLPNTYGGEGFAAATVYAALQAGRPVQVWIETGWARPWLGTWTAWDGRRIRYSLIEHAVTLSGVSAWSVRVNDPLYGTQYWVSKATFEAVWADFNNMAVVFQ